MYKKIEVMEKKFEKFEKAQNKMKDILKNKLISTQFVEEEIVIDVKFVNDSSERIMLLDNGALRSITSTKWFNGYLQDAKVSEEEVKKISCARKFRMGKTVYLNGTKVTFPIVLKTEDKDYVKKNVIVSVIIAD